MQSASILYHRLSSTSVRRIMQAAAAVALASATSGCVSSEALRASAGAMTGMLWARATAEPGYDLYAQNMAESQGVKQAEAQLATNQDRAANAFPDTHVRSPQNRGGSSPSQATPPSQGEPSAVAGSPRELAPAQRSSDDRVRVTLGRPESLPILQAPLEGSPQLASAPPALQAPPEAAAEDDVVPRSPRPRSNEPTPELAAAPVIEPEDPTLFEDLGDSLAESAPTLARGSDSPESSPEITLRQLLDDARARLEQMATYQVKLTRVERVGSQLLPEESAHLSIRRQPKAVRLFWSEGPGKGREVIYSSAIDDRTIYVNNANTSIPFPARLSVAVDNPLIMRNSRHGIDEAGFDTIFDNMDRQVDEHGRSIGEGRISYKGLQAPPDSRDACHLIQRITPSREIWRVYLEPDSLMPVVVTAHTSDGDLLESYRYEGLSSNPPELASIEAFDPDKRWGEAKGLFSRLANAAGNATSTGTAPTQTR